MEEDITTTAEDVIKVVLALAASQVMRQTRSDVQWVWHVQLLVEVAYMMTQPVLWVMPVTKLQLGAPFYSCFRLLAAANLLDYMFTQQT